MKLSKKKNCTIMWYRTANIKQYIVQKQISKPCNSTHSLHYWRIVHWYGELHIDISELCVGISVLCTGIGELHAGCTVWIGLHLSDLEFQVCKVGFQTAIYGVWENRVQVVMECFGG
jgi:hypothetical protein